MGEGEGYGEGGGSFVGTCLLVGERPGEVVEHRYGSQQQNLKRTEAIESVPVGGEDEAVLGVMIPQLPQRERLVAVVAYGAVVAGPGRPARPVPPAVVKAKQHPVDALCPCLEG